MAAGGAAMLRGGRGARLLPALALLLALGACLPMGGSDPAPPITGPEVETSTLPPMGDAGGLTASEVTPSRTEAVSAETTASETAAADAMATAPDDAEITPAEPAPAAEAPAPVVKSAAHIACEADRGRYVRVGSGSVMACQRLTRDAGESCSVKSDCQGECLARSRTCAPLTPLFGCNEILQDDGRRVSLCID
nr:hypothetical protein [Szabonella alba]